MWVLQLIKNGDIIELNVQVLIHALQSAANGYVILEFNRDRVIHEGFKEAEKQHFDVQKPCGGRYRDIGGNLGLFVKYQGGTSRF